MTRSIAIFPRPAILVHAQLLRALGEAFPVRFVGSTPDDLDTADAVVVFPGGQRPERPALPCLILTTPATVRTGAFSVEMTRRAELERPLRGQRLVERHSPRPAPVHLDGDHRVLAVAGGEPVWVQGAPGGVQCSVASALPSELGDREFLRDHLVAGRFWSLLPLVHFLKTLCHGGSGSGDVQRACFIIDDPNVRFSSYGYVSYPALARDAREHGYHVAIATIPLDLLLPGRRAAAVFRDNPGQLSLVVHGNDHVHGELGRTYGPEPADRLARAALARVGRFERRAGLRIERVMCPPHGACSAEMLAALFRQGFSGLAASRPFPWDGFADHGGWRLGGWLPAQLAGGGLPVIPRHPLSRSLDDLVFRALLGLPLVLYGHQSDLRDGLEPLRAAVARAATLGEVEWTSLAALARSNALVREHQGEAIVTLYSRDVRLPRPPGDRVRVELPRRFGTAGSVRITVDGESRSVAPDADGGATVTFAPGGDGDLRIRVDPLEPPPPATLADWRPRAWPLVRRAMTETRDRALPLLRPR